MNHVSRRTFLLHSMSACGAFAATSLMAPQACLLASDEQPKKARQIHFHFVHDVSTHNADKLGIRKGYDLWNQLYVEAYKGYLKDNRLGTPQENLGDWTKDLDHRVLPYSGLTALRSARFGVLTISPDETMLPLKNMVEVAEENREEGEPEKLLGHAFVFYYNGHGATDPKTGHYLAMSGGNLSRKELRETIRKLPYRLKVLITDSCSNIAPLPQAAATALARDTAKWRVIDHLFAKHTGFVDINSSTRGQFSWGTPDGGIFTRVLLRLLCKPVGSLDADGDDFVSWKEFTETLRSDTNNVFQKIKANAPADSEVQKSDSQDPEIFELDVKRID